MSYAAKSIYRDWLRYPTLIAIKEYMYAYICRGKAYIYIGFIECLYIYIIGLIGFLRFIHTYVYIYI